MRLGVEEIRNLLLNNHKDVVAAHIVSVADDVVNSLGILDKCVEVMETYKKELADGKEFANLFVYHVTSGHKTEEPDFNQRAKNFSKAIFKFVVDGMPIESKAKAKERLAICELNECGYFDGSVCRHLNCGCFAKIKTFFSTEHCPIGKW